MKINPCKKSIGSQLAKLNPRDIYVFKTERHVYIYIYIYMSSRQKKITQFYVTFCFTAFSNNNFTAHVTM